MRGRKCSSSWFGPRMWAGSRRGRSLPCGRGLALPEGLLPPRLGSGPSMSGQARRGWRRPCFCLTPACRPGPAPPPPSRSPRAGKSLARRRRGAGRASRACSFWALRAARLASAAASRCSLRAHIGRLHCPLLSSAMAGCDDFLRKGVCPGQEGRLCIAERSRGLGAASQGTWSLWGRRDGSPFGVCSVCIQCLKQKETGDPV
ncbi:uncharacterized protein LOC134293068 [Anolis carolinensis]|uniref:uncharacterized protein LOC134293068 n=1 Tax=Anolis carolinensis TaxID=28377 RepID=UPI002F2B75B6